MAVVYADQDDVLARAGRFAGLFNVPGRRPNLEDLDEMLVTVSAAITAEIGAHGYDASVLTAELLESLRDVAAWATLVRALPQASPGDSAIDGTVARGQAVLKASGFSSLGDGTDVMATLGAIATLESGAGGGGQGSSAGSFWDSLPESDSLGQRLKRGDVVVLPQGEFDSVDLDAVAAQPAFRRGMSI